MKFLKRVLKGKEKLGIDVDEVMQQCIDFMAVFEMFLGESAGDEVDFKLSLVKNEKKHLVFEVIGGRALRKSMKGMPAVLRVAIKRRKGVQPNYYGFTSTILGLKATQDGQEYMAVAKPDNLDKITKRKTVRITLPDDTTPSLRAWMVELDEDGRPEVDLEDMGEMLFEVDPDAPGEIIIHNISAGGMRISFAKHLVKRIGEHLQVDNHILLWAALADIQSVKWLKFLIVARIARVQAIRQGRTDVGLHFLYVGGKERDTNQLGWRKVSQTRGVEGLARWVHQRTKDLTKGY